MAEKRLILVTGATGHQGGAVLRQLRERGFTVRAATRDPEKSEARRLAGNGIEVAQVDLDNRESIARAVDGVYGVYSVQDSRQGPEAETRQANNITDAAKRAMVSHLVYSSVASADKHTGIPFFDSKAVIEEYIRESGLPFTIIRPVFFMENWMAMKESIGRGVIELPLSPHRFLQMIAVDDIGAFVAMAFENPGKWQNRAIDIAGDDLSMEDIARSLTRANGREVRYHQISFEEMERRAGKPLATMYRWLETTGYDIDIDAVRTQYPHLTGFERWLQVHWPKAQSQAAS
jgi:uncharacterized protein YbjT (DUF2867 family)